MRYPNAAKGVSRIFSAEILNLIFGILITVSGVCALLTNYAEKAGTEVEKIPAFWIMTGSFLVGGVLKLISIIMNIVGISNASKDEENFKNALLFLVLGMIATAGSITVSVLVKESEMTTGILDSIAKLLEVFVYIFVVSGIVKLADRYNRGDISAAGTNVLKILILVNVIVLIAGFIVSVMGGQAASIVTAVLTIIAGILSVVQYIMYLSLLAKAKKMLQE